MSTGGWGRLNGILSHVLSLLVTATRSTPNAAQKSKPANYQKTNPSGHTSDLETRLHRTLRPSYSPQLDGDADPGEVVWTWVPYVENDGRGKDRPVLIIARLEHGDLAACALSTKEHHGYLPVGSGGWDSSDRASYLNPERILRVPNNSMRREGNILPREKYNHVISLLSQRYGFTE